MEERLTAVGNENISTAVTGQMMPLDLLEKLGRYQGMIGRFCTKFRRIKSIIIWEDSMASFWITAKCLVVGLVSLVLPWRTILYLVGKIVVWGFLGPHMKLVDLYLQSKRAQQEESELENFRTQTRLARIRREEAMKLKDMKCLAFGEFVALVPSENLPRHYDHPLHESFARYVSPSVTQQQMIPATSRIPGQQLYGLMIPNTKSGLVHQEEEKRIREMKLASLAEQVTRLQSIEKHLSSRLVNAGLDEDLPDDLGYEVTLCDDMLTSQEESQLQEHELSPRPTLKKDSDITVSLSPSGFKDCNSREEQCIVAYSSSKSQFLAQTASLLAKERLTDEDAEDGKKDEWSNASCGDQQSCNQFDSPSGDQSEYLSVAAEDNANVDQNADYLASLLACPNPSEPKSGDELNQQSFVEEGIEVDPSDDSYMTPLVEHSGSAQERGSVPLPAQENPANEPESDQDGTAAFMTPGEDEPVGKSGSFMTWNMASHEEEKKEQEEAETQADLTFMTPEREEEERKDVVASAMAFLELKLSDCDQSSVKSETQKPSSKRQLMGPRQKSAAISVRSIGSGSVSLVEGQTLKPNNFDESIQVKSIGAGSLRAGSDEELVIEHCKAPQMERLVVTTCQLSVEGTDEGEVPTPRCRPSGGESSPAFKDCIENEASRSTSPSANGNMEATESAPACKQSSTKDDWLEAIKTTSEEPAVPSTTTTQSILASETDDATARYVPFNNPNFSIMTSDTDVTAMTNNTKNRPPSCSQSLRNDDTTDPLLIRKTWSSGSLQRERTWIKENPTDSVLELSSRRSLVIKEEGMEIVAMGRLRTIGDEVAEDCDDDATINSSDTAPENHPTSAETESPHRGLSVPYKSNSFVQVATYRP